MARQRVMQQLCLVMMQCLVLSVQQALCQRVTRAAFDIKPHRAERFGATRLYNSKPRGVWDAPFATPGKEHATHHNRSYHSSVDEELVWLYSLIAVDHNGASLIPHFLRHYTTAGISKERVYLDLLHDPSLPESGLLLAQQLCMDSGVSVRLIRQQYSPDLQDQTMASALARIPCHMEDWIVVADMDEFVNFGSFHTVADAVKVMNAEGSTFALGEMLDHVAPEGNLTAMRTQPDIWAQFPLVCPIISNISRGLSVKVTIAKAYLRTGAGHHHIVEPSLAYAYFSNECTGIPCELVMKRYKERTLRDLYNMTPYSWYPDMYAAGAARPSGWQAKQWSSWTKIHHFKWHLGEMRVTLAITCTRWGCDACSHQLMCACAMRPCTAISAIVLRVALIYELCCSFE